jgi:nucleoredoxin
LKYNYGKDETEPSMLENIENIGLYFSALWCPPCKMFNPKLTEVYKSINEKGKVSIF